MPATPAARVSLTARARAPERNAVVGKTGSEITTQWAGRRPSSLRYAPDKVWKRLRLKAKQTRHHSPAAAAVPRKENWRKPSTSLRIPPRRDVGLNAPLGTRGQGRGAKVASIQRRRLGRANRGRDGCQRGFGFLAIVGMIGEGPSHDEQTRLIHGHLRVVILLKARMRRAFHDARLRVREVVLVAVARSWHRWRRWAATRSPPCGALPLRALRQLGLILRLLGCRTLLGASFQHRFGLFPPCQAILA